MQLLNYSHTILCAIYITQWKCVLTPEESSFCSVFTSLLDSWILGVLLLANIPMMPAGCLALVLEVAEVFSFRSGLLTSFWAGGTEANSLCWSSAEEMGTAAAHRIALYLKGDKRRISSLHILLHYRLYHDHILVAVLHILLKSIIVCTVKWSTILKLCSLKTVHMHADGNVHLCFDSCSKKKKNQSIIAHFFLHWNQVSVATDIFQ